MPLILEIVSRKLLQQFFTSTGFLGAGFSLQISHCIHDVKSDSGRDYRILLVLWVVQN